MGGRRATPRLQADALDTYRQLRAELGVAVINEVARAAGYQSGHAVHTWFRARKRGDKTSRNWNLSATRAREFVTEGRRRLREDANSRQASIDLSGTTSTDDLSGTTSTESRTVTTGGPSEDLTPDLDAAFADIAVAVDELARYVAGAFGPEFVRASLRPIVAEFRAILARATGKGPGSGWESLK